MVLWIGRSTRVYPRKIDRWSVVPFRVDDLTRSVSSGGRRIPAATLVRPLG